jgi:cathepsin B
MRMAVEQGLATQAPIHEGAIPTSFDSAQHWPQCSKIIGDILDQSNCGCCWAFGAAEAASDRMCIATNGAIMVPLSPQDVCFCSESDGCDGGDLITPWHHIRNAGCVTGGQQNKTGPFLGMCSDFSLPHCHHHGPQGNDPYPDEGSPGCPSVNNSPNCPKACDASAKAPHNIFSRDKYSFNGTITTYPTHADTIAAAIMAHGPVEAAFSVYADFENYVSGIYKHTTGAFLGGHAIKIVGWGEQGGVKYWKVANSWNPYWGEAGYFRIVRGTDECGIESDVTSSSADAKWFLRK